MHGVQQEDSRPAPVGPSRVSAGKDPLHPCEWSLVLPCLSQDVLPGSGASWCRRTTSPVEPSPVPGPAHPDGPCGPADVPRPHGTGGWASPSPRSWPRVAELPRGLPEASPQGAGRPSGAAPSQLPGPGQGGGWAGQRPRGQSRDCVGWALRGGLGLVPRPLRGQCSGAGQLGAPAQQKEAPVGPASLRTRPLSSGGFFLFLCFRPSGPRAAVSSLCPGVIAPLAAFQRSLRSCVRSAGRCPGSTPWGCSPLRAEPCPQVAATSSPTQGLGAAPPGLLQALLTGLAEGVTLGWQGREAQGTWAVAAHPGLSRAPGSQRAGLSFPASGQRWEGSVNPRGLSDVAGAGDVSGCRSISGPWAGFGGSRRLNGQECGICDEWLGQGTPGQLRVAGSC